MGRMAVTGMEGGREEKPTSGWKRVGWSGNELCRRFIAPWIEPVSHAVVPAPSPAPRPVTTQVQCT
jgi:hypothetical protein